MEFTNIIKKGNENGYGCWKSLQKEIACDELYKLVDFLNKNLKISTYGRYFKE